MKLADAADALAYDTAFWLLGFQEEGALDLDALGQASAELGGKLRALAIISLLTSGDTDKFLHTLVRSARVRETFLVRMNQAQRRDDHELASGRVDGLLDAIASGDLELARRIAWISPREWQPQREYEDDFCYAQVLHRLVHGVQAADVYEPLFERFESALQGHPDARLAVVRALATHDEAAFDAAFEALVAERRDAIDAAIARCQLEDPQIAAERQVFVEGLALLRLAAIAGLATRADHLYCPSNARASMRRPVSDEPDGFITE